MNLYFEYFDQKTKLHNYFRAINVENDPDDPESNYAVRNYKSIPPIYNAIAISSKRIWLETDTGEVKLIKHKKHKKHKKYYEYHRPSPNFYNLNDLEEFFLIKLKSTIF